MTASAVLGTPTFGDLKAQAKLLLHGHRSGARDACERIAAVHPRFAGQLLVQVREAPFALVDALLVVARECGAQSWPQLLAERFTGPGYFVNEPAWEWAIIPDPARPLGASGCLGPDGCFASYERCVEDDRLRLHLALGESLATQDVRPVVFDEDGHRFLLRARGTQRSQRLALLCFDLPYSEVPHDRQAFLGVEVHAGSRP